jgi:hypothetical protein
VTLKSVLVPTVSSVLLDPAAALRITGGQVIMNGFDRTALRTLTAATMALGTMLAACNEQGDNPYKPQPAWSGKAVNLPSPPSPPSTPIKTGDGAYTIYGAVHQLRSLLHSKDVTGQPITIVGYIVDSNIPRAPDCVVHKTGKKDPDNCPPPGPSGDKPPIEVPSFWIADEKGNDKGLKVRVVGWARNYAVIFDAMKEYRNVKAGDQPKKPVTDDMLNVEVPFPLPAVGAKVRVTGAYNVSKVVVSDMVSEPTGGVLAYQKIETVEPAPEPAKFAKSID